MTLALLLVGFGHVGRRFVQLLDESRPALASLGIDPVVVGIVTRRHGARWKDAGLNASEVARDIARGDMVGPVPAAQTNPCSAADAIARLASLNVEARVLVETTTLDIQSGEPAIAHVRQALTAGIHVVTANKGPAAFAYRALANEAARANVSFLFEGAVMDGIPVFSLVRDSMPALEIRGFRGVLNSTTNHILTALESGESFDAALTRMQAAGVAEADPSLDIDGWDAAAKTAALANVWLDAGTTPLRVEREGIGPATAGRAAAALANHQRLKLVCGAGRDHSGRVWTRVALQALDRSDPLANLDGQANAIEIDTWPLGRVVISQRDGGLEKTAYALVSDLATVARRLGARP